MDGWSGSYGLPSVREGDVVEEQEEGMACLWRDEEADEFGWLRGCGGEVEGDSVLPGRGWREPGRAALGDDAALMVEEHGLDGAGSDGEEFGLKAVGEAAGGESVGSGDQEEFLCRLACGGMEEERVCVALARLEAVDVPCGPVAAPVVEDEPVARGEVGGVQASRGGCGGTGAVEWDADGRGEVAGAVTDGGLQEAESLAGEQEKEPATVSLPF